MSFDYKKKCDIKKEEQNDVLNDCLKIKSNSTISDSKSSSSSTSNQIKCVCQLPRKPKNPPNILNELNTAKSILQECSTLSGDNSFDHLAELIRRIIDQRPTNVIDYFEEFSRNIREQKFHTIENFMESVYESPKNLWMAECILTSLNIVDESEILNEEESEEKELPILEPIFMKESISELQFYWSKCGFGIKLEDSFQLTCALQNLIQNPKIESARFWGKIFGLRKSYYIIECDLTKFEIQRRQKFMLEKLDIQRNEFITRQTDGGSFLGDSKLLNLLEPGQKWKTYYNQDELETLKKKSANKLLPTPTFLELFDVPPELVGVGINRKTYFVLNSLTENWKELPVVTPKQIVVSRKIKKFFTGDLEQPIVSYPDFPGVEKHYLRAMIARITASTYIAPVGYYRLQNKKDLLSGVNNEEEEEEEEEEDEICQEGPCEKKIKNRDPILIKNEKYVPPVVTDLLTPYSWVHIRPSILPQGRIEYIDIEEYLNKMDDEGEDEEEEEEDDAEEDEEKLEKYFENGPPIFSKCEDDTTTDSIPPWTIRLSAIYNRINQIAIVKSNIWQGAYSFSHGNLADSIYFGWGHKYIARNYTPTHVPQIQNECPFDFIEIIDPTPAMEEDWNLAHLPSTKDIEIDDGEENDEANYEE